MLIVSFSSGKYKGLQHTFTNQEADSDASVQGERNVQLFFPLFSALHQFHTLLVLLTSTESLLIYSAISKIGMMPPEICRNVFSLHDAFQGFAKAPLHLVSSLPYLPSPMLLLLLLAYFTWMYKRDADSDALTWPAVLEEAEGLHFCPFFFSTSSWKLRGHRWSKSQALDCTHTPRVGLELLFC